MSDNLWLRKAILKVLLVEHQQFFHKNYRSFKIIWHDAVTCKLLKITSMLDNIYEKTLMLGWLIIVCNKF